MIRERLAAQLLSGPPALDPVAVVERLLAVQGQDPRGFRLAVRARTAGLAASDVDRALDDGSLLVTWLNRGTLHLVLSEDYAWLHALTTPPLFAGNARRLAQEGVVDPERAVAVVERSLGEEGPLTRAQLGERLGLRGQGLVHVLFLAAIRGLVVRGPTVGSEQAYVLVREWLPPGPPVDRGAALAELARRFLAGHGPAGDRDLAKWAGLPLRDARVGLTAIGGELVRSPDGLVDLAARGSAEPPPLPPPRLLGSFDPLLHGWADRTPIVGDHAGIVTDNGLFRPFALVRGRAVATWSLAAGRVDRKPFARLPAAVRAALAAEADDVRRFLAT